jgi:hypothetical protein
MNTKNFYLAGLLSFLFCAGSVEASKYSSHHVVKIDDVLQKDKDHFIKQMRVSKYYDIGKSLEDASEDYLYLANLLSQWGMEDSRTKKAGGHTVRELTWYLSGKLPRTNPPKKPWERLLLDIARKYRHKDTPNATQQDGENKHEAVFNHSRLDDIIANYNLMSFTDVETIQQEGQDGNGKYRLLNDWAILFFHCNEAAIHYGVDGNIDTVKNDEIQKNNRWMEDTHTYVQLWYPIFSISTARPKAPRMSPVLLCQIKRCEDLCYIYVKSIRELFERTLDFMGLEYDPINQEIKRTNDKIQHIKWIKSSHNFARITRYLQALSIVVMHDKRVALLNYVKNAVYDWNQFCDNDEGALKKLSEYKKSIQLWSNAENENEHFERQVNSSLIEAIIRTNKGGGLSRHYRYWDAESHPEAPGVYEDEESKKKRGGDPASLYSSRQNNHEANFAKSASATQLNKNNAWGASASHITTNTPQPHNVQDTSAVNTPQNLQQTGNQLDAVQSTVVVGSPAPQPISSDNSAAPQQKIRKNKAQGKRQRRRGKKTNRKSNRKSRKTRKTRKL